MAHTHGRGRRGRSPEHGDTGPSKTLRRTCPPQTQGGLSGAATERDRETGGETKAVPLRQPSSRGQPAPSWGQKGRNLSATAARGPGTQGWLQHPHVTPLWSCLALSLSPRAQINGKGMRTDSTNVLWGLSGAACRRACDPSFLGSWETEPHRPARGPGTGHVLRTHEVPETRRRCAGLCRTHHGRPRAQGAVT